MKVSRVVSIFIFGALSMPLLAGSAVGTIGELYVHNYNSGVYFRLVTDSPNYAACATSNRYGLLTVNADGTANQGAINTYSAILAAKAAGQQVHVQGAGNCNSGSQAEMVSWITVKN